MINMTNVEYIDYFEKIIANEPENILSLYFVQKLMSDVRFRSFQPMISAELQKKILKMVLPKLKNQFKINRLVDFNPIGVADEEIEILNKESVTDVGTFVKTLDDGKVCKEIENLQMEFQAKTFQCMNAFQAPYKAVLISLYESAVKNGNTAIAEEVKENFDVQVEDIAHRFRDLGLDDSLVRPSYVVNVSPLQEKINKTIRNEPEVEYHKDNEAFLKTVLSEFKMLTGEADA